MIKTIVLCINTQFKIYVFIGLERIDAIELSPHMFYIFNIQLNHSFDELFHHVKVFSIKSSICTTYCSFTEYHVSTIFATCNVYVLYRCSEHCTGAAYIVQVQCTLYRCSVHCSRYKYTQKIPGHG